MRFLACAAILLICPEIGFSQGTAVDYQRSATIGRDMAARVFRSTVRPHWIDGSHFWYRNDLPGGKREFVLVDAAAPSRKPAFDNVKVAAALSKVLGTAQDPSKLPVDNISLDGGSKLQIQVGLHSYQVDPVTFELSEVKSELGRARALNPQQAPRRSGASTDETVLTFVNQLPDSVKLWWLDSEGNRHDYGSLTKGARREMHTYASHVWLVTTEAGDPVCVFLAGTVPQLAVIELPGSAAAPRQNQRRNRMAPVSPQSKYEASIRNYNVYIKARDAAEVQLTTDGSEQDRYEGQFYWSPDATRLLVFKTTPAQEHKVYLVESSPADQLQPKLHANDYLKPGDKIAHPAPHLYDLTTNKEIPLKYDLMSNPWSLDDVQWDPGSNEVTILYNQRGHQVMRLIAIDAKTGACRPVIDEVAKTFIDWTNKVYLNRLPATHEAIWMSERDGWNHLYLYNTSTGQVKNQITRGKWVVRGIDTVDPVARKIWFHGGGMVPGHDPYYIDYACINFDGTGLTMLTDGDGTHSIEYSPVSQANGSNPAARGKYLIDTYSRVDMAPVTALRDSGTGRKIMDLEHGDASGLLSAGYKLPERFVTKARDGATDIFGVICRPSTFDPSRSYPVIENIYAGPQGSFVPKAFGGANGLQSMAELGFIVVQIDGLGTNNRSKAFHDYCWKNLADAGFEDRILWIKAAAARYHYMDLSRVGIYGTSAGGQNALGGMLLHGDFYKVGVADCGCHDNRMDKIWWNEQWMGWPVGPEYAASSNVTYASKLQGKLFLMVGEMDTNVDPSSTMQVVNALIKSNKDFDLLVMPGAGHGVAGTPYGRRRLQDFFVRNLLASDPRAGAGH